MGRMKRVMALLSVIFIFSNSINTFAKEETANSDNNSQYVISIDASQPGENTGKTLQEVLGNNNQTRATQMPSTTWSWNSGNYSGSYSINYEVSYSLYNFSGYSQYYVDSKASRDIWTAASDNYTVYLMQGSGQGTIVTQYNINSTEWQSIRFYNLQPGTKYAVCFSKANDGSKLSGSFYVRNS